MTPKEFKQVNTKLTKPDAPGFDDCGDMPSCRTQDENGREITISCWTPTPEELAEIIKTGSVWLIVWGGQPPVCVTGIAPFEPELQKEVTFKLLPPPEDYIPGPGFHEGDTCNRDGCIGIIKEGSKSGDGCSCHINPPCGYCTEQTEFCETCGWEAENA